MAAKLNFFQWEFEEKGRCDSVKMCGNWSWHISSAIKTLLYHKVHYKSSSSSVIIAWSSFDCRTCPHFSSLLILSMTQLPSPLLHSLLFHSFFTHPSNLSPSHPTISIGVRYSSYLVTRVTPLLPPPLPHLSFPSPPSITAITLSAPHSLSWEISLRLDHTIS